MAAVGTVQTVLSFNEPDGLRARGTVVVIPGRGERSGVYQRLGTRLAFDAYRVRVVSDPVVDEGRAVGQLDEAIASAADDAVLALAGSDTGALFAAALLARGRLSGVDALVLAGIPTAAAGGGGSWDEELDARTTCPTHRARISDALVTPGALYGPVPQDWAADADLNAITQPILALHGQADPISSLEQARLLYAAAPAAELVSIAGARHDVLNDQTHRTVAATVVLWLERLRDPAQKGLKPIAVLESLGTQHV
jgi:pimeloyl-ACP methyl ester carboxylesterase